jgi:signal peptidase I
MTGRSMEDTVPAGATLSVERYGGSAVQRGDIVVFIAPDAVVADSSPSFVKRVIGLPGESVAVHDGATWINGQPLAELYIKEPPGYTYGPVALPADSYFVLGDNRNNSSDSHAWNALSGDKILGRVVRVSGP